MYVFSFINKIYPAKLVINKSMYDDDAIMKSEFGVNTTDFLLFFEDICLFIYCLTLLTVYAIFANV